MQKRSGTLRVVKPGLDPETARRGRQEVTISLRKEARDDRLLKRRTGGGTTVATVLATSSSSASASSSSASSASSASTSLTSASLTSASLTSTSLTLATAMTAELHQACLVLLGRDLGKWPDAIVVCRRHLSIEKDPPIDQVIEAGVVPAMIACLDIDDANMQFESAWCLTNVASGTTENVRYLVDQGILPKLMALLKSESPEVVEQVVWCLGQYCRRLCGSPRLGSLVWGHGGMSGAASRSATHTCAAQHCLVHCQLVSRQTASGSPASVAGRETALGFARQGEGRGSFGRGLVGHVLYFGRD